MSILKDRIRPLDPSSLQEFLDPDREAEAEGRGPEPVAIPPATPLARTPLARTPLGKISFQLASRGGYVRTVTGTVAYLDEEAQTYMVSRGNGDGELLRVPLRDITSAHERATGDLPRSEHDVEGLGTTR
jgi:hypothetical protein